MKANWFVGIPVDGGWMERVPPPPAEVRLFHTEDLHLTIAFFGACGEERARRGFDALAAFGEPPIDATLGEVVPMGSARRFSALSALLVDGRADVERVIGEARGPLCVAAGAAVDERPPKAHLTLARPTRRATDADRRRAMAWAKAIDLRGVAIHLERVALYTWAEDRSARMFQVVASRPLGAPPTAAP